MCPLILRTAHRRGTFIFIFLNICFQKGTKSRPVRLGVAHGQAWLSPCSLFPLPTFSRPAQSAPPLHLLLLLLGRAFLQIFPCLLPTVLSPQKWHFLRPAAGTGHLLKNNLGTMSASSHLVCFPLSSPLERELHEDRDRQVSSTRIPRVSYAGGAPETAV